MSKKQFIIDGSNFNNLNTFYDEVERVLCPNLDFQWGKNLNAFNDILRGGFGAFEYEESIDLIWRCSEKSKNDLGYQETMRYFRKCFWCCFLFDPYSDIPSAREDLKSAKERKGQTLFDIIVEIIKDADHVNLIFE